MRFCSSDNLLATDEDRPPIKLALNAPGPPLWVLDFASWTTLAITPSFFPETPTSFHNIGLRPLSLSFTSVYDLLYLSFLDLP